MPNPLQLDFAALSDTGLQRPHNEDAIAISPDFGLVILADGMGGYNAGEVASNMAITIVRQVMEAELQALIIAPQDEGALHYMPHLLCHAVLEANAAIISAAQSEPQYSGMGTTLVMALFHHDQVALAHVGDSRCYRWRTGVLDQITRDHSQLQEQIDAGLISPDWAHYAPNRNLITRAVGVEDLLDVEVHEYPVEAGDLYLLCSDGLSDMLLPQQIVDILEQAIGQPGTSLQQAAETLVAMANEAGGRDNISVILVQVQSTDPATFGLVDRILGWIR